MLLDKKTVQKLGSSLNHTSASKPSGYAVKLMEKMGWKEGQGLGKNEDGMASHVVISKRDDNLGLGLGKERTDGEAVSNVSDHWWHMDFGAKLKAFKHAVGGDRNGKSKKSKKRKHRESELPSDDEEVANNGKEGGECDVLEKKSKKSKKEKKDKVKDKKKNKLQEAAQIDSTEDMAINYDELFKATGGARLGMRARREQKGKIFRTEGKQALISSDK